MKATKTKGSQRVLPMSALFIENAIFDCDGEGPWIANEGGGRMSPSTGRHMYARYMAGKDLPQVTLENMRHSFATACLHAGMNVEDVSKMLGHADINTTFRRYVKPDLEDMRVAFRKIPWSHEDE